MPGDTTARDEGESRATGLRTALSLIWVTPDHLPPLPLTGARVTLGREPSATVQLLASGVSRQHVEIYRQGPIFSLKDLGSTNGTFLNGQQVTHAAIEPNAVLRVGDCVGIFQARAGEQIAFSELAPGLYGAGELAELLRMARLGVENRLPIVIVGETGTGKERMAHAIHGFSGRSGPLHAVNCAAIPSEIADAELFGYRKGAFTGAERAGVGHLRAAHGGTLFLDEIADLPLELQAKLLRAIEDHRVTPLGEVEAVSIDIRLVAALQRHPDQLVRAGKLREDLYARLGGLVLQLPPLRERRCDVLPLFWHFLRRFSGGRAPALSARLVEALLLWDWPKNVRELELLVRRLLALHSHEPALKSAFLPPEMRGEPAANPAPDVDASASRRDHDLERLAEALHKTAGNVKAAAELAGFSRQRAYRLLAGTTPEALMSRTRTRKNES